MSGECHPMTCCDAECARANHCEVGGIPCRNCGRYFCASEIGDDGLCDRCYEDRMEEAEREMDEDPEE